MPQTLVRAAGAQWVNDVHSRLNRTRVARVERPASAQELVEVVADAARFGEPVAIAGGKHAMGGQQFASGGVLIDTRAMDRVLHLDASSGVAEVEAGIQWPQLMERLLEMQQGTAKQWGIRQKQTGADRLSIGGALAANIHGRGLRMKPFIGDVDSFKLVDAEGRLVRCSRTDNAELFALVAGGYGLFGVVASVRLRLARRRKVRRIVREILVDDLVDWFDQRIAGGFLYGDFQFAVDPASDCFLRRGVFSCYEPAEDSTPIPDAQAQLSEDDWRRLIELAHVDKTRAYRRYADYYLSTDGQVYWSDLHQLAAYLDDYHGGVDQRLGHAGSEMITELYVPRERLADFMAAAAKELRGRGADVIYGTVRLIEKDDESFLAWAKEPYACVIFNLHVTHTPSGVEHAKGSFRALIDLALDRGGSFYLTYHRWATAEQMRACYPQFGRFFDLKRQYDADERFQSDWYRHAVREWSG